MNKYSHGHNLLSADKVRDATPDVQKEIMDEWFRKNFENPSERTPYIEGDFYFMHGGPYDEGPVLWDEFGDIVPENVIDDFIKDLAGECWEWAPTPDGNFYEQGFSGIPRENFVESIKNIKTLLPAEIRNVHQEAHRLFYNILYVNVITAVEAYLADAFHQTVGKGAYALRHFVQTTSQSREQRIAMPDTKTMDGIVDLAIGAVGRVIWHRLKQARKMYKKILGVEFPKNTHKIARAVQIRHSIVHENDSRPNGKEIIICRSTVEELIAEAEMFVADIDKQIKL